MFELNYILYFTSYVNLTEKSAATPIFSSLSSGTWGFLGGSVVCVSALVVNLGGSALGWSLVGRLGTCSVCEYVCMHADICEYI